MIPNAMPVCCRPCTRTPVRWMGACRLHAARAIAALALLAVRADAAGLEATPLMFEREFALTVAAGRDRLNDEDRLTLTLLRHPVLDQLKDDELGAPVRLLAGLPDGLLDDLLADGYVKWPYASLDAARQSIFSGFVSHQLTVSAVLGTTTPQLISLDALERADVGFAVVDLPDGGGKVVSMYILMPGASPLWTTVVNAAAGGAPGYFRAHMMQLPLLRARATTALPEGPGPR